MNARRLTATVVVLAACASEAPPPGTGPDFDPPRVIEFVPGRDDIVPGWSEDVVFRFDEPMADPIGATRGLEGSPAFDYRVEASRARITVQPRDGWRDGVVYQFTIPAGVRDLLGNRTTLPIELLFSTGPPVSRARIEGKVFDRITLAPVRDARLLFLPPDSTPYTTRSDTAGAFRLRSLPPDEYRVYALNDRNRNIKLDRDFEAYDSALVVLADTFAIGRVTLWLVEPDSTPPVLVEAVVLDSSRIRLQFDDPIEPDAFPGDASVVVTDTLGMRTWEVSDLYLGSAPPRPAIDSLAVEDTVGAAIDSLAVDSLAVDSLALDEPMVEEPAGDTLAADLVPSERIAPSTAVIVDLSEPLQPGSIRVTAAGFANLRLLVGGGETDAEYVPPDVQTEPGADDEAPADAGGGGEP